MPELRARSLVPLVACALALASACGPLALPRAGPAEPGVWLADAFAGRLQRLDEDLVVVESRALDEPRWLVSGPVLFAGVAGGARIEAWRPGAQQPCAARALARPARAATLFQDELVVVLGRDESAHLLFLDERLEPREEAPLPLALAVAGGAEALFVATAAGELRACRGRPLAVTHRSRTLARIEALALAPDGECLWTAAARRVSSWSRTLERRWERGLDAPIARLVPAGAGSVWCVLVEGRGCVRLDAAGAIVALVPELPCARVAAALARPGGGLFVACTGALLEIDGAGTLTRTQGGFGELSALAGP